MELDLRPWFIAAAIICGGAIETSSRPRSLHRNTGKLGCFQFSAVQTLGLYELNATDRTAVLPPLCRDYEVQIDVDTRWEDVESRGKGDSRCCEETVDLM
ncbi:hypothetical protein VP1G_11037 [Cytospora mali]|uniref:Uncharacterized protein n=1 Tax=Cytospora mali TaxID=578113 RepID=A0A194V4B5_CYTMA|nr:hypothetical protein VP1G_11037 [Valsa mali var. pyri (nom. inval.)]